MFGKRKISNAAMVDSLTQTKTGTVKDTYTTDSTGSQSKLDEALQNLHQRVIQAIDINQAANLPKSQLIHYLQPIITKIMAEANLDLSSQEIATLQTRLIDEMVAFGPIQPLISDDSINDILVNGAKQVYIERDGKLEHTNVQFRDDEHVMNVLSRILTHLGRRIDEAAPYVDARLSDGSRVNAIIPPLAVRGPTISIRKFRKKRFTLNEMVANNNLSETMAKFLTIAIRSRLNILISGGTGAGKTTLLNALSHQIDDNERIITIEDVAELQLQKPHVVPLETRLPTVEHSGEVTQRDLFKNALRMRPDRIIIGEIRGAEAFELLQAMNTGHDGSICTIHASNPQEVPARLINMVAMTGFNYPPVSLLTQFVNIPIANDF